MNDELEPDAEITAVRGIIEELGLPGLIDVHTHFMPKAVMDKVWDFFDNAGANYGRSWPIAYREDEQVRLDRLRRFGVTTFTSMIYPHKPGMAAWLNAWAVDFAARTPDCLHTATFYPEPSAGEDVRAALEAGARVFKSHVQVGGFDPRDPLLDPVWGQLQDAGVPTVIHAGSGPMAGTHTGPEPIRDVLRRFPRLPLIIAHLGMPEYEDFLDIALAHEAVHLDTTMSFTPFTESAAPTSPSLRARYADAGDRILLGTDYPNIPYSYLHALESVLGAVDDADWQRAVLHDNGARLFGVA